jgi:hypothetical protein
MTIQCTTCGTQTRSGAKFCHACGTPIATASLPSTLPLGAAPPVVEPKPVAPPAPETEAINRPTTYMPQTPQTYHAPPPLAPASPDKKSSGTLKVVLISLALIMILGIASVIGAVYFVSQKASRAIADLKHNMPTVTSDNEKVSEEELRVPIYPGAQQESSKAGGIGPWSGRIVTFLTSDDVKEVADFYRDHFKGKKNQQLNIQDNSNEPDGKVVFQVNGEEGSRIVTISPDNDNTDQTKIVILTGKGPVKIPPPPPPPPADVMDRKLRDIQQRALEQAEKALRDAQKMSEAPPPARP